MQLAAPRLCSLRDTSPHQDLKSSTDTLKVNRCERQASRQKQLPANPAAPVWVSRRHGTVGEFSFFSTGRGLHKAQAENSESAASTGGRIGAGTGWAGLLSAPLSQSPRTEGVG
jgi:hypothetical protein